MDNVLKIGLLAGGTLLAYNYFKKKNANIAVAAPLAQTRPMEVKEAVGEEEGMGESSEINDALKQQQAGYFGAGGVASSKKVRKVEGFAPIDGWDSDTISTGL